MTKKKSYNLTGWLRFLEWFCPPELYEGIEGDLLERFEADAETMGKKHARRRLAWQVIRFLRPGIILRNKFHAELSSFFMIKSYVKVASRNMMRRKLYSFINAFGLSIGIAFCILIYLFIQDEKSFDQFHENKDRIYRMYGLEYDKRLAEDRDAESVYQKMAHMQLALGPVMKAELPEVEYATHFCSNSGIMRYEDKVFKEPLAYVDPDFFRMFSFPLLHGNRDKLFRTNEEIVLTPALARKYFGDANAIGETILLGDRPLTVTGIIEAPPANSSLDFNALVPMEAWRPYSERTMGNWVNMGFPTFVQLHANADLVTFRYNLDRLTEKYMGDLLSLWREERQIPTGLKSYEIGFTKLTDIHFEKEIPWERVSDPEYSWILGGIAMLILLIACINYVSLALTTSARRRTEVGIRKVTGAHRKQLVFQFGFESVMLAMISMFIGMGMVALFLPAFNEFTGKAIGLMTYELPALLGVGACISIVIGLLAGCYPALFLSGFRPVQVLKGNSTAKLQANFTKPLAVLQFIFSAFLMISSVVMYQQMKFVATKDLGFDQHEVVVIPVNMRRGEDTLRIAERFRQVAFTNNLSVRSVTATDYPFAIGDFMVYVAHSPEGDKPAHGFTVDPYFIRAMGIQVVKGRDFDADNPADASGVVIVNEALAKSMGWQDPLHERLRMGRRDTSGMRVIGVVKDFHFLSLEHSIEPMFLTVDRNFGRLNHILVKISSEDIPGALNQLQRDFATVAPDKPFEYAFMDENIARQYASFRRWVNIMGVSTGFAILISCLGLFGLSGINAVNRTKEVGIRKVLGASVSDVVFLLNKQFVWFSLIAFVLAAPLSWYAMEKWLSHFRFRITLGWELFAVSLLIGSVIALATVSYHAVKAAVVNPANTLKYE